MENLLSLDETAEFLGIASITLRKLVRENKIEFYKVGRRLMFDHVLIDKFLELNRHPIGAELEAMKQQFTIDALAALGGSLDGNKKENYGNHSRKHGKMLRRNDTYSDTARV
jgi:excisionase family DNA binding protein